MKKIFLFAAAMAVALSSCSKNEVDVNSTAPANAIGFDNYTGNSTKGSVINGASINKVGQQMGVYANLHPTGATSTAAGAPNFMSNEKVYVKTTASEWTYDYTKYWPTSTDQIDFFAYAPYAATPTAVVTGYPVMTFTQSADLADMVDYIYAAEYNQTKTSNTTTNGQVDFKFKHALSRVAFSAKTDKDYSAAETTKENGTYIYVTKIVVTVNGNTSVDSKFDLTFNNSTATTAATAEVADAAAYYADATAWTIFDKVAESGVVNGVELDDTDAVNFTTLDDTDATELADATADDAATANKYLFLVPQTIAGDDAATTEIDGAINVDVTYYTVSYAGAGNSVRSSDVTKTLSLPAFTFAQGVAYNFPIVIGLDAITFGAVEVEGWSTPSETIE